MINIGDTIDNRYNVLAHLGTGGMAVVFECKDLCTGDIVALKIMKEELLGDEANLKSFKKEIKSNVSMSHVGIVHILEEGNFNGRPFLVMEYMEHQTLLDKLEYLTKFSVQEACEIMIQLLDAVDYTHKHKIIHRDIKPQNIFYLPNGTIKLADFGISANEKEVEKDDKILGSVHYLAPEVLRGKKFSVASDIYAAGITFYQILTGRLPFDGTTLEIGKMHIHKTMPKPSLYNYSADDLLDSIVLKATAKDHRRRYKSAHEFSEDIEKYRSGNMKKKSFFERLFC